jgi:hypothetical protein
MNRAREAELAVLERDRVGRLRDAIDGAVVGPIEDDARRLAAHPRIVLRVVRFERVRLLAAGRRELDVARSVLTRVLRRVRTRLEALCLRERDERAAAAARVRHHELLGRPIARDVRLARRQARCAFGSGAGSRRAR